ncbi:MAG: hypothetical protein ABIN96_11480, partial [Rubrivivax sp.]
RYKFYNITRTALAPAVARGAEQLAKTPQISLAELARVVEIPTQDHLTDRTPVTPTQIGARLVQPHLTQHRRWGLIEPGLNTRSKVLALTQAASAIWARPMSCWASASMNSSARRRLTGNPASEGGWGGRNAQAPWPWTWPELSGCSVSSVSAINSFQRLNSALLERPAASD